MRRKMICYDTQNPPICSAVCPGGVSLVNEHQEIKQLIPGENISITSSSDCVMISGAGGGGGGGGESAFAIPTPNWRTVTLAAVVPVGPDPVSMYVVPPDTLAMLMNASNGDDETGEQANATSFAVRDSTNLDYFIMERFGAPYERWPVLFPGDSIIVWNSGGTSINACVSLVVFDQTFPDGSFYQPLRFSTQLDAFSVEYTVPAGHTAILCPNVLPAGESAYSIIFGVDKDWADIDTKGSVTNIVDGVLFTVITYLYGDVPFETRTAHPQLPVFKAGDTLRLGMSRNRPDRDRTTTAYATLIVKPL